MPDHRLPEMSAIAVGVARSDGVTLPANPCRPGRTAAVLMVADVVALAGAALIGMLVRSAYPGAVHYTFYAKLAPLLGVFVIAYAAAHLYPGLPLHPGMAVGPVEELRRTTLSTSLVCLALAAAAFLTRDVTAPSRAVLLLAWALALVLVPTCRALLRAIAIRRPWWGHACVVLGGGAIGGMVVDALLRHPELGLRPIAVLDDDPANRHPRSGVPAPGGLELAARLARERGVTHAVFAMPEIGGERLLEMTRRHAADFPHPIVIPDLAGFGSLWVTPRDLGGVLGLEVSEELLLAGPRRLKRAVDVLLVALCALPMLPILGLLALAIRLESRGPAIFRQTRLGLDGREFEALKFRTMHPDAEARLASLLARDPALRAEYATYHKLRHDPRVTRIGRWLRTFSLDELPQLWNVWRGDMSLVGPRAYIPAERPRLGATAGVILRVLPGITGLWQISGRNAIPFDGRLRMDVYYVRNWNLWLDLYILVRTPWRVLRRDGAW